MSKKREQEKLLGGGASINAAPEDVVASSGGGSGTVAAPLAPFLVLVAAFVAIAAALVALSLTVGGCHSAPAACYRAALAAPRNATPRCAAAPLPPRYARACARRHADPPFLLPLLTASQLLGATALYVVPARNQSTVSSVHEASAHQNSTQFRVQRACSWVTANQVLGQYARVGTACACNRANRTTLGAARVDLRPPSNHTALARASAFTHRGVVADLTDQSVLHKFLKLAKQTEVRAAPTATFAGATLDYLFMDIYTKRANQSKPVQKMPIIAFGDLTKPPLKFALPKGANASTWTIRPNFVFSQDNDKAVYMYFGSESKYHLARVANEEELQKPEPSVSYYVGKNTFSLDKAKAEPLDFGCSIQSFLPNSDVALCLTAPVNNTKGVITNQLQLLQTKNAWSRAAAPTTLLTSEPNAPFLSATWHSESYVAGDKADELFFSTIADTVADLPTFWSFKGELN